NLGSVVFTSGTPACAGGVPNDQTEILTAANGDSLTIVSSDVACPVGDPALLRFHGTGHWVVTGGTGRFSGVSGQGSYEGHGDFLQGTFDIELNGTISAPNGN